MQLREILKYCKDNNLNAVFYRGSISTGTTAYQWEGEQLCNPFITEAFEYNVVFEGKEKPYKLIVAYSSKHRLKGDYWYFTTVPSPTPKLKRKVIVPVRGVSDKKCCVPTCHARRAIATNGREYPACQYHMAEANLIRPNSHRTINKKRKVREV
jgi:hypothetical protein